MTGRRQLPCPCRVDPDGRRWTNLACHVHGLHVFGEQPLGDYELRSFVDEATLLALEERQGDVPHMSRKRTPARRAAVQELTAHGATAGQIATVLGISPRTVTRHRTQGAKSR